MNIQQAVTDLAQTQGLTINVMGKGPTTSEIAVVGLSPTNAECRTGTPISEQHGSLLFNTMRKHTNFGRHSMYVSYLYKRRVIFREKKMVMSPQEQTYWTQMLLAELSMLPNLRYIVVLGEDAMHAITGEKGIHQWRGSVIPAKALNRTLKLKGSDRQVTAIISHPPQMALANTMYEPILAMDLKKLARHYAGEYPEHEIEYHIRPSFNEAMQWIDKMQDERLPISVDIETMSNETACIGMANDPHIGYCLNFRDETQNVFTHDEDIAIHRRMQKLFDDPDTRIVAQNGNFDTYWLGYKNRLRMRVDYDTLIAHHTLYPQLPHGLAFLVSQYTTHPYYKDDYQQWRNGADLDVYWRYNVKDVCLTLACWKKLENELRTQNLWDFYESHIMRLQPHLARMTIGGVKVDTTLKAELAETIGAEVEQARNEFHGAVHELFPDEPEYKPNPNAPKQLAELFFDRLRLIGKGRSTDAANRERLIENRHTGPIAKGMLIALNRFKTRHKFLSTYVNGKIDEDGRMRCEYKQFGTQSAPGRLSSSAVLWGTGGNLQNQPEEAHQQFVADEGYCLVYFDLAQAEARVVAWLARIAKWKEDFERARIHGGFDCHRSLAADMFQIPYDKVPTFDRYDSTKPGYEPPEGVASGTPTMRFVSKRCRHGLNYRMQWPRLAETAGLNPIFAHKCYTLYHRATPELAIWWDEQLEKVRKHKQLISPKGRRWIVLGNVEQANLDSIIAFEPQSTIGDHVCEVIYLSHDDEDWPDHARIALNIHDALIALVPNDKKKIEAAVTVMRRHAERPIMIHGDPLIIPADFKISQPDEGGTHRWSTLKDL